MLGVTVEGTNDQPTLGVDNTRLEVTEKGANSSNDYTNTDGGQATGADADHGAELHYSFGNDADGNPITSVPDQYGTMHIDPNTGRYWYELNNNSKDTQALEEGQKVDPTGGNGYTIRVTDEHGAYSEQHVEVEITGTNDNPYLVNGSQVNVWKRGDSGRQYRHARQGTERYRPEQYQGLGRRRPDILDQRGRVRQPQSRFLERRNRHG